jgi:hypothetical protein
MTSMGQSSIIAAHPMDVTNESHAARPQDRSRFGSRTSCSVRFARRRAVPFLFPCRDVVVVSPTNISSTGFMAVGRRTSSIMSIVKTTEQSCSLPIMILAASWWQLLQYECRKECNAYNQPAGIDRLSRSKIVRDVRRGTRYNKMRLRML